MMAFHPRLWGDLVHPYQHQFVVRTRAESWIKVHVYDISGGLIPERERCWGKKHFPPPARVADGELIVVIFPPPPIVASQHGANGSGGGGGGMTECNGLGKKELGGMERRKRRSPTHGASRTVCPISPRCFFLLS